MKSSRKSLAIICVLVLGLLFIFGGVEKYLSTQHGNVTVNINLSSDSDTKDMSLTFNNHAYVIKGLVNNYVLHHGNYTITINKPGYKVFSTQFSIQTGGKVIINPNLQLTSNPPPINSSLILVPGISSLDIQVNSVSYYYNNTWAIAQVDVYGSGAVIVLKYNPVSKAWESVLGPGTYFTNLAIGSLPKQVQQYLITNSYIGGAS